MFLSFFSPRCGEIAARRLNFANVISRETRVYVIFEEVCKEKLCGYIEAY